MSYFFLLKIFRQFFAESKIMITFATNSETMNAQLNTITIHPLALKALREGTINANEALLWSWVSMFEDGFSGRSGMMAALNITEDTLTRALSHLVQLGYIRKTGETRCVVYHSNTSMSVNCDTIVLTAEEDTKTAKPKKQTFDFRAALIGLGVSEQTATDWLAVRKSKGAVNTETSFKRIASEIEKSGLTAEECITTAVTRNWQGFSHEWIKPTNQAPAIQPAKTTYTEDIKAQWRDFYGTSNYEMLVNAVK